MDNLVDQFFESEYNQESVEEKLLAIAKEIDDWEHTDEARWYSVLCPRLQGKNFYNRVKKIFEEKPSIKEAFWSLLGISDSINRIIYLEEEVPPKYIKEKFDEFSDILHAAKPEE